STEGDGALLICSHGDVIKSILADALGMHLDQFQRISVGPASVSVVRYTEHRPFVELLGETGSLAGIVPSPADGASSAAESSDAVPGGATGDFGDAPPGGALPQHGTTGGFGDAPPGGALPQQGSGVPSAVPSAVPSGGEPAGPALS
ncbi:MAG: histidine phosphatase family protein, partial [Actinomycetota bacterium]|nr:histidine phosphatase family protein [Actinomycetota bacterium]